MDFIFVKIAFFYYKFPREKFIEYSFNIAYMFFKYFRVDENIV